MQNGMFRQPSQSGVALMLPMNRYFNRDVECIRTFFKRRFRYESALYPRFTSTIVAGGDKPQGSDFRLDVVVAASGFKNNDMRTLEQVSSYQHQEPSEC
jgi:RIO kinase 2